ncbi:GIY-YIG nuclease family protein [Kribbella shirazensis]|uniref:Putative GIY-YIG superfamily endonuclease n=1 Tax=Kribbella shirazensis TaxID=1105143 RepID=A0A7X5VJE0_9ACTN|nr:GIY-YIG nuclease family protein [Kribbella shirazensis]NIK61477.1 putative GIY-YIG superfamily endonuclease [Kribbella shirazensis]
MAKVAVPRFSRFSVSGLHSVAHLFPKAQRCGVYILEFGNGERYVGQAVDVVRRFGNHRRIFGDIVVIEFAPCRRAELSDLERRMIQQQRARGYELRNIVHGLGPLGDSDLDPLILPSEQHAWLTDPDVAFLDDGIRAPDDELRRKHRPRYQRLKKHPAFPFAAEILNWYVPTCLPKPAKTERTFWAVSAMPGTNRDASGGRLCTLSANKMETLFLVAGEDRGSRYFGGVANVSARALTERAGDLSALRRQYRHLSFGRPRYESGGGDVLAITFVGVDGCLSVWDIPGAVDAARALNLMLMRKGPTLQWRWHCYDLADWAFASESTLSELWDQHGGYI